MLNRSFDSLNLNVNCKFWNCINWPCNLIKTEILPKVFYFQIALINSFFPWAFNHKMSKHSGDEIEPLRDGQTVRKTSTFRRLAPQVTRNSFWNSKHFNCHEPHINEIEISTVKFSFSSFKILVAITKNLISFNKSLFDGFSSVVIPALQGIAVTQNPNETIHIESSQSSWLCKWESDVRFVKE